MFILLVSIKRKIFTHICLALSLIVLRHIFSSMKFFQLCLSMHLTLFLPRQLETMTNVFTNILQQMYVDRNRVNWDTEIYFKILMDIYKIWRHLNLILAFCFVFWDELRSIFEAYKLVLIVFLKVNISFWILSWIAFFRISANFDNRRQRWEDNKKLCCEKGTQWWRGNFVWKQIAQENTRIQGTRNKMWISMEISLPRQFPCSAIVMKLYNVKIGTGLKCPLHKMMSGPQILPVLNMHHLMSSPPKKINQQTVRSQAVTYWVIYQWKKRLKRLKLRRNEYWIFEKSPDLDITPYNSSGHYSFYRDIMLLEW